MSKGAKELLEIVQSIFPHQRVELEHNVAPQGGLFVDIYLPGLKVGFEYDGIQHFKYNEHFHGSRENFIRGRRRDLKKDELCEQQGITLIRIAYSEDMTKDLVLEKLEAKWNG